MAVRILSPAELEDKLQDLSRLLSSLPADIKEGREHYNFDFFWPDPELLDDIGPAGALNHALEITFKRKEGIITFKEKGPGLTAVVDVLRNYNQISVGNAVLQKWVLDLHVSAIKAGEAVCLTNLKF